EHLCSTQCRRCDQILASNDPTSALPSAGRSRLRDKSYMGHTRHGTGALPARGRRLCAWFYVIHSRHRQVAHRVRDKNSSENRIKSNNCSNNYCNICVLLYTKIIHFKLAIAGRMSARRSTFGVFTPHSPEMKQVLGCVALTGLARQRR